MALFLLVAVGFPAAAYGLAWVMARARRLGRKAAKADPRAASAPKIVPSWVPFTVQSYLAAVLLVLLVVVLLFVVMWAVALHVLDKGYSLAELLLFVALLAAGIAYAGARGALRMD